MQKILALSVLASLLSPLAVRAATIVADGTALNVTSVGAGTAIGNDGYHFFAARTPAYNNFNVPDKTPAATTPSATPYATYVMNYNGLNPPAGTQNYSFDSIQTTLTIDGVVNYTGTEYTALAGGGGPDTTFGTITLSGTVPDYFQLGLLLHNRNSGSDAPTIVLDLDSAASPISIVTSAASGNQNDFYFVAIYGASAGDTIIISAPGASDGAFGGLVFSVPEPSTGALMLLSTAALRRVRRGRNA